MSNIENWKHVCIKDICESITDCVNKTAPTVDYPTNYKMIRTTNVKNGWIDLSDVKYVTQEVFELWTRRIIPKKGDIILTREAPLGEVAMVRTDEKIFLGQRLVQFRADLRYLDNRFLLFAFQGHDLQLQIKALGSGATVEHMRVPEAKKLTLLLPPLPEQHRIADILSAWDHSINLTTQLITAKEQYKRGLMQQLLTGKKRFASSKGWSWRKIGDLFRSVTRFEPWDDEKIYIQAIVRRKSQGIETRPPLLGKQIKTKNLQVIRKGDFLISDIQASYGAMCMVGDQQDGLYVSNVYTILVPRHENQIYTSYFDQLSRTPLMRHLVVQSSNGFKAERIRLSFVLDTFMQQQIYLPEDIAEQKCIADLLQLCDDEITLLNRKLALLKKQKQGLMQQLLTGKVRVKT